MDDGRVNGTDVESAFPRQTSVEKLRQALDELEHTTPETPLAAALAGAVATFKPMLELVLPDDPTELDEVLLVCAKYALVLRSDDAQPLERIDELYLGPDEPS